MKLYSFHFVFPILHLGFIFLSFPNKAFSFQIFQGHHHDNFTSLGQAPLSKVGGKNSNQDGQFIGSLKYFVGSGSTPPGIPIFLGCYQIWSLEPNFVSLFTENMSPHDCFSACNQENEDQHNVVLVRGIQCICKTLDDTDFSVYNRLQDGYCNLPYLTESGEVFMCGGNIAVSAYCYAGPDRCNYKEEVTNEVDGYKLEDLRLHYDNYPSGDMVRLISDSMQCLNCFEQNSEGPSSDCFGFSDSLVEAKDYFPLNDPIACVLHCRRRLLSKELVVAYLGWREFSKLNGKRVPYCVCEQSYPSNDTFVLVDKGNCGSPCPQSQISASCGNSENLTVISAYCTTTEPHCLPLGEPPYLDPGYPGSSTVIDSGSTQAPSTSTSSSTSWTMSTVQTSTTAVSSTTTTNTPTTTSLSVTTPSRAETTKPPGSCHVKCKAIVFNRVWESCSEELATMPCRSGATGIEKWFCMANGTFQTPMPDSSSCVTEWYQELKKDFEDVLTKYNQSLPKKEASNLLKQMEERFTSNSLNEIPYYGHEISNITDLVQQIINVSVVNLDEMNELLGKSMTLSGILLKTKEPWLDLGDVLARARIGTRFFENLEASVFTLSKLVKEDYLITHRASSLSDREFVLDFGMIGKNGSKRELIFPASSSSEEASFIQVDFDGEGQVGDFSYVGYLVDTDLYKNIFPEELNSLCTDGSGAGGKILNSKLLSLTLNGLAREKPLRRKVRITFQNNLEGWKEEVQNIPRKLHPNERRKVALNSAVCVYWSVDKKKWDTNGCKILSVTTTYTVCECDHLTSFAVLMDQHNYVGREFPLEMMTFLLCPISVICLIISVVVLSAVDAIQSQRTTITKHLCICLLLGIILLLFFVDRNYFFLPSCVCAVVGAVTHYIYLSAFMWMAIEGIHLYKMVVHVFDSRYCRTSIYRCIAYGIPFLIVGTTCVVGFLLQHHPYGGEMYCWLNNIYIWVFIAPVGFIVMVNLIILFVALKTAIQMRSANPQMRTRQRNYRFWIRGSFSITVLLGLTWMPGFVLMSHSPLAVTVAAYFFVLLNASQGIFLFIFHCFLNEKVRRAAQRNLNLPSWLSLSSIPSNQVSKEGRRSQNNRGNVYETAEGAGGRVSMTKRKIAPDGNGNNATRIYNVGSDCRKHRGREVECCAETRSSREKSLRPSDERW